MTRHTLEKYAPGYVRMWQSIEVRPEYRATAQAAARRVTANRARYEAIEAAIGVPWWFVGIIHKMECNLDFAKHLHNGDKLTGRTWRVPAGRPLRGSPPFTWEVSAIDALTLKGLHKVKAWTLERVCFELERYNGFGYRARNIPTPYLWSFSTHYVRGKFERDHVWDPRLVSSQTGALVLLRALADLDRSIRLEPGANIVTARPVVEVNEDEVLPTTPSAWRVLARSRTVLGSLIAGIGAGIKSAFDWLGPIGDTLAGVAQSAEGFHASALQLAGYIGATLPWIGGAAIAYGLFMAITARVVAENEGKIG